MTFDPDRRRSCDAGTLPQCARARFPRAFVLPAVLTLFWTLACGGTADEPALVAAAEEKLKAGDLPGAKAEYDKARAEHPDSVYVAQGLAYENLLEGKYDEADKLLADAEGYKKAKDEPSVVGEIKLRRALVALRAGNLDAVKTHGDQSNTAVGKVLAAEVHLADAESDEALKLLKDAAGMDSGLVGETAKKYIEMLESDDPMNQGLAEATALWALGQRQVAVEAAEELVKALPEDREDKNALLLLWAGRAVTSGRPGISAGMLDAMGFPPEGQAWRIQATRAMIDIAEGRNEDGIKTFTDLAAAGAPADGLSDALATAAGLTKDREVARNLAGQVESIAAARGLYEAGAVQAAKGRAPGSTLNQFLEVQ